VLLATILLWAYANSRHTLHPIGTYQVPQSMVASTEAATPRITHIVLFPTFLLLAPFSWRFFQLQFSFGVIATKSNVPPNRKVQSLALSFSWYSWMISDTTANGLYHGLYQTSNHTDSNAMEKATSLSGKSWDLFRWCLWRSKKVRSLLWLHSLCSRAQFSNLGLWVK
jgi:hypothetical protein